MKRMTLVAALFALMVTAIPATAQEEDDQRELRRRAVELREQVETLRRELREVERRLGRNRIVVSGIEPMILDLLGADFSRPGRRRPQWGSSARAPSPSVRC